MLKLRSVASLVVVALGAASNSSLTPRNKAFFADKKLVSFVRPGLVITIRVGADCERRNNKHSFHYRRSKRRAARS